MINMLQNGTGTLIFKERKILNIHCVGNLFVNIHQEY